MTNKKEPLGRSYTRDYVWPATVNKQLAFGSGSNHCESAKDIIFPESGAKEEKPEFARMYEKTHSNYQAGAQKTRDYDLPIDPKKYTFGYGEHPQPNQAGRAIHSERAEDLLYPKTVVVKKAVEDLKAVQKDHLGTVRNLG